MKPHASKRTLSLFTRRTDLEAGPESRDGTAPVYPLPKGTGPRYQWHNEVGRWRCTHLATGRSLVVEVIAGRFSTPTFVGDIRFDQLADAAAYVERQLGSAVA